MNLLRPSHLFVLLFLLAAPAWAALPPLDDVDRESESSEIFRGEILAIYTRERVLDEDRTDTEMLLEIEVESTKRGVFTPGQVVLVKCWQPERRPRGWVGDGGQRPSPTIGARGVFYAKETQKGRYSLLNPNGWDCEQP